MKYSLLLLMLVPTMALAQRDAKIPDPDPEIERKSFILPPGFEVNLFAADPMLAKPIQMNFDPQGRLWVASSEVYPQIKPGQVANDKILILEDTKGTGVADKVTVFADGLLIPTGVLPGDGGAYVANSTEIIHLSASKPGGKADRRRVVLDGFGTEDTHHIIHTFRWGPDGAMYFNQSIYIHSSVETPSGTKRLNAGGIWRYEPKTQKLSVFARGWVNSWGHQFDKYGNSFATDGAGGEGINHVVPGASYTTAADATRILHGLNPGSPKHCGLEIISGRHFPDDWQGDCITNDFRGHRVCRFKLRDDGSTFESREMTEVIKSKHPAFRPIDCAMGPDGALYIADWYNPIIQHGEVDFRDERRDHTHGRIWRVTAKGRPLVTKRKLEGASVAELVGHLTAPENNTRLLAKRMLVEHSKLEEKQGDVIVLTGVDQIVKELDGLLAKRDPQDEQLLLEALWIYRALHIEDESLVQRLMSAKNPAVRAALARYLSCYGRHLDHLNIDTGIDSLYQKTLTDESPRVRLEAIRSIAQFHDNYFAGGFHARHALMALDKPMDATLDYALWLTLRELKDQWLPAFQKGHFDYGNDMKKLAFALQAVQSPEVVKPLVALLKADKFPDDKRVDAWALVAKLGGPAELEEVINYLVSHKRSDVAVNAVLVAVEDAARRGVRPSPFAMNIMVRNCTSGSRLCRLVGYWKLEEFRRDVESELSSSESKLDDERAAMHGLVLLGGPKSIEFLAKGVKATYEPRAAAYLASLVSLDTPKAATLAADRLATLPTGAGEVVEAFMKQKNGAAILAKALADKKLPPDIAKLALRSVRSSGNPSPALTAALTKAGNLAAAKKDATPEEVKLLAADALKLGDAARGELVFRRKKMQCLACHAIGGAGGQVGPDLTSIGASAQPDYLVESLLLPNKAIKEGYHTVDVTTLAGRIVSGVKLREANGELVLRDKDDKEITIRLDDIDTRRNGRSLMPDGLTEPLTRAEFLDLTRFLSELGKLGAYEPSKARVVRRWESLEPKPGSAVYSKVSGDLPLTDVPQFTAPNATGPRSQVRFKLQVTAAGEVKLKANSKDGLTLLVSDSAAEFETPIKLTVGEQAVTVIIDRSKRNDALRVELEDIANSAARANIIGGK